MKNPAMVALESALIEDPDYTVAKGGNPGPYERHHLDLIADRVRVRGTRGFNYLDVWQYRNTDLAGVTYTEDRSLVEVVPVKATYTIEEGL